MPPSFGKLTKRVGARGMENDNPQGIHHQSDDWSKNNRKQSTDRFSSLEMISGKESGSTCSEQNNTQPQKSYLCLGSISVLGRKRTLEDAVKVVPGLLQVGGNCSTTFDFFAVYDGHGGSVVAEACQDRMHPLLVSEVRNDIERSATSDHGYRLDWQRVMRSCFAKMDQEIISGGDGDSPGDPCSPDDIYDMNQSPGTTTGATAVVVLVSREEIVVANCGRSRSVLCHDGKAVPLSFDHKPDRPDERERIEAAGGRVVNRNGARLFGVLATSRSLGDKLLKPYVICEPEVCVHRRTEADEFIVIASDGLWDVMSNETACEVVKTSLKAHLGRQYTDCSTATCACTDQAAALLTELALARGSTDNISVVIVQLQSVA